MNYLITVLSFYSLLAVHSMQAMILLVNPSAPGSGNRISTISISDWNSANAYTTLQSAIVAAQSGDEIWVKAGTYKPSQNITGTSSGATDKTNSFLIPDGVSLYGGFAGDETVRTMRNIAANVTTLSGDYNNNDVVSGSGSSLSFSGNTENAFHVVIVNNPTQPVRVDGFRITGGFANQVTNFLGVTLANLSGAGLLSYGGASNLTIESCTFFGNSTNTGYTATGGAGIYVYNGSPAILNCKITHNLARNGGAIDCHQDSSPIITNCILTDNRSMAGGGALYTLYSCHPVISRTVFANNYCANLGGAVFNETSSNPAFTNCLFVSNTVVNRGGAVHNNNANFPLFMNCTFYNNQVTSATGTGGAINNVSNAGGTITNCIFYNNTTPANSTDDVREEIYCLNTTAATRPVVSYSILRNAFPVPNVVNGGNNITNDPVFIDASNPTGADGKWMTTDDGLSLFNCSPAVDAGTAGSAPTTDVSGATRPQKNTHDLGAYEVAGVLISPVSLSDGTVNVSYSENLFQTGLTGTTNWSISAGALPDGLNIDAATGAISGTPLNWGGVFSFTITVTSAACPYSEQRSITIDGPLPIVLADFSAVRENAMFIRVSWNTLQEVGNSAFELEQSYDGYSFVTVTKVQGAGNSERRNFYERKIAESSPAYYRLKQIDEDGAFTYSQIVYTSGNNKPMISLYPNPCAHDLFISGSSNAKVELINSAGEPLEILYTTTEEGLRIDMSPLQPGIYLLRITAEAQVWTERVVKSE